MATIKEWPALRSITPQFALNIKNVFIFDEKAIFLITNNDFVYGFGENTNGCVGCGHNNKAIEPKIINELRGKTVVNFQFGVHNSNVLALTANHRMYSWGGNSYGQLGNGNTNDCHTPNIIEGLNDLNIIDIRCGNTFCVALTGEGKLYAWGDNKYGQLGIGHYRMTLTPTRVTSDINQYKINAIECGGYHSLALTDKGIMLGWGYNQYGQLGIGRTDHQSIPKIIDTEAVIYKIRCGYNHSLLLSIGGDVYAFGLNDCGQIGNGSVEHKISDQIKLDIDKPLKCVDIAATHFNHISIAKLENGFCYVWGKCDRQTFDSPQKTHYNSINDVIINFSKFKWNYFHVSAELNV